MESFSALGNLARVSAGLKGGPFFKDPVTHNGKMRFSEGWPSEVTMKQEQGMGGTKQSTPIDVWNQRRANGSK